MIQVYGLNISAPYPEFVEEIIDALGRVKNNESWYSRVTEGGTRLIHGLVKHTGLGHFGDGGRKCFIGKKCFWNILFMSIWWPGRKSPAQEIITLSNVWWKDSANGSVICQLWCDRISPRDCPRFPNGLVQFLMILAGRCGVSLAGICVVFICGLVLTCRERKS